MASSEVSPPRFPASDVFSHHPEVCAAELDGELCLFHPVTAQYLNLNATGSAIWRLLEQPFSREALVAALMDDYDVEEAHCRLETDQFLADALAASMLEQTGAA
ncbi:MAG: PqqD family protein [Cyanobium sp.]|jgi:hypothetical protein